MGPRARGNSERGRVSRGAYSGGWGREGERGGSVTVRRAPLGAPLVAGPHRALRGPASGTISHAAFT